MLLTAPLLSGDFGAAIAPILQALMWCLFDLTGSRRLSDNQHAHCFSDGPSVTHCLQCRGVTVVSGSHQE